MPLGALLLAALVASPAQLAPAQVLARYEAAVAALREPPNVTFDYVLTQGGTRAAEQRHRIFRHGDDERDETLDPQTGRALFTRIFRNRKNRYAVGRLAPRASNYVFVPAGTVRSGKRVDYVFATRARYGGAFTVTQLTIDGQRFLPSRIAFSTRAHAGRGSLTFAPVTAYGPTGSAWVVVSAQASADEGTGVASESIAFSSYRFPRRLPPATFTRPRPLATPAAAP